MKLPRPLKLLLLFFCSALVFTFFVMVLIRLLNPSVAVRGVELLAMYFDLLRYFGPVWLGFVFLSFLALEFFAGRSYRVGFFRPPTLSVLLMFTVAAANLAIFFNYRYYADFFSDNGSFRFYKVLFLQWLLLVVGLTLLLASVRSRRWLQPLFLGGLALVMALALMWSGAGETYRDTFHPAAPAVQPPRKIRIVILEGLSLNYLLGKNAEQKLRNFGWLMENGVSGRIATSEPNTTLALLNSLCTGLDVADFPLHSDFKYSLNSLTHEFDIFPRYIFFRSSSHLGSAVFYKKNGALPLDFLQQYYEGDGRETLRVIRPEDVPSFAGGNLQRNNNFVQFFPQALNSADDRLRILKRAFHHDDYLLRQIPDLRTSPFFYSLSYLEGLETVNAFFYHFNRPGLFGSIPAAEIEKYGWVLEHYYQYYDSILGNLIRTTGSRELLVVLSFYEVDPLPLWRRFLLHLAGDKDIYVYRPSRSPATIFLYENNALRKGLTLEGASLYDVFPTLLYYAGFPLSRELRGEVLKDIFTDEFISANPIQFRLN